MVLFFLDCVCFLLNKSHTKNEKNLLLTTKINNHPFHTPKDNHELACARIYQVEEGGKSGKDENCGGVHCDRRL